MELYALTDNMIISKVGETIKRLRLGRNVSQKELALSAGVSISCVAALELGEKENFFFISLQDKVQIYIADYQIYIRE